ncbi:MAG: DMT family transporter [Nitrosopumilaceae archaeon]
MRWLYSQVLHHQKLSPSFFLGYVLALSAAALAALMHVIPKPLLESTQGSVELNPIMLAFIIYIMNGLFFTPLARNSVSIKKIEKKNLVLLSLIGLAEVSAMITYFFGLKDSTATNGAILSNSEILFSILIAIIIYRERLKKRERSPFSIIIIGLIALPVGYDFYHDGMALTKLVTGDLLILLSGLFYALDINICKYVTDRLDSKRMTQITSFASGGFALCLILLLQIPFEISLSHIPGIMIAGIAGTGMSAFFFVIALRLIGTVRTILLYSTGSIFGVIFSAIFLSEAITLLNVISILLVLSGVYLLRNRLGE